MAILDFGSLNIDYVYDVDHFVQGGETLASTDLNRFPGGKGLNQSIALAKAGAPVVHGGQVGRDGEFLVDLLRESGVDTGLTRVSPEVGTGHAIIQRDPSGQNCILLYGGANRAIGDDLVEEVFAQTKPGDWLLLQNEVNGLDRLVREGKAHGLTVVLNPSPADQALDAVDLTSVDMLILNEVEASVLTGLPQEAGAALADALAERYPQVETVLTLGSKGSVYAYGDKRVLQDAFVADAVDTTGAGDTFTGYLLAGLMAGLGVQDAMRRASAASAIAVTRKGAAVSIPTSDEVDAFLADA